jgi:hypothetical protein
MGNTTQTMSSGAKAFTDTFGPGGTFDVLFRDTMIKGITNQANKLLISEDAVMPSALFSVLETIQKNVAYAWSKSLKEMIETFKDVNGFLQNTLIPFLERTWATNKWEIIGLFIILNPIAFISFAITLTSVLLRVYFLLVRLIIHPIVSMVFHKIFF